MQYSKPVQMLVEEHDVICSVLDATEAMLDREDNDFPQDFFERAFEFFVYFADKCHHAKEEVYLFPRMADRGVPQEGGPIGCMLSEHEAGRAHVAAVRAALKRTASGDSAARETVRRETTAFVALLRQHIYKEDNICFPMGDRAMTDQDKDELWTKFQHAEEGVLPPGTHAKYVALAKELVENSKAPAVV
jgi:hemerythrin-like domain-containing protein